MQDGSNPDVTVETIYKKIEEEAKKRRQQQMESSGQKKRPTSKPIVLFSDQLSDKDDLGGASGLIRRIYNIPMLGYFSEARYDFFQIANED